MWLLNLHVSYTRSLHKFFFAQGKLQKKHLYVFKLEKIYLPPINSRINRRVKKISGIQNSALVSFSSYLNLTNFTDPWSRWRDVGIL